MECYTTWRSKFEGLTRYCTLEEKGDKLLGALEGKAMKVLPMLQQQEKPQTYKELDTILTKMFTHTTSFWFIQINLALEPNWKATHLHSDYGTEVGPWFAKAFCNFDIVCENIHLPKGKF